MTRKDDKQPGLPFGDAEKSPIAPRDAGDSTPSDGKGGREPRNRASGASSWKQGSDEPGRKPDREASALSMEITPQRPSGAGSWEPASDKLDDEPDHPPDGVALAPLMEGIQPRPSHQENTTARPSPDVLWTEAPRPIAVTHDKSASSQNRADPNPWLDRSVRQGWVRRMAPELLLSALALIILTVGIAQVPLVDPDEARYAAASRAMLDRGDLVVPYFNGSERLNKPALFYWLQAASFSVLGPGEGAARLPSVVAALLALLAVYSFARRELDRSTALRAVFILLTCPLFAIVGKTGITDMTLSLFVVVALLLWYRSYVGFGRSNAGIPATQPKGALLTRKRVAWFGVSVALGLAFFVKGPVGVAVPCLVIAVFLVLRGDWAAVRLRPILAGIAVAACVFMPWGGLLAYRLGAAAVQAERVEAGERSLSMTGAQQRTANAGPKPPGVISDAASAEAGQRAQVESKRTSDLGSIRSIPPDRNLAPASTGLGSRPPLMHTLRLGASRILELLRHETVDRTLHGLDHPEPLFYFAIAGFLVFFPWFGFWPFAFARVLPELKRREPGTLFLVVWFVTVLVFFSLVRGKLPTYILSAAPPLALLLAREWSRTPREHPGSARWVAGGGTLTIILTAGLLVSALIFRPEWLGGQVVLLLLASSLILLAVLGPILYRRADIVDLPLAAVMAIGLIVVPLVAGRTLGEGRSLRTLAQEAGLETRPWSRVISYKTFRPSLVYYGHRSVISVDSMRDLRAVLDPESLVVLEERRLKKMRQAWQDTFRIVAAQGTALAITPVSPIPPKAGTRGSDSSTSPAPKEETRSNEP